MKAIIFVCLFQGFMARYFGIALSSQHIVIHLSFFYSFDIKFPRVSLFIAAKHVITATKIVF